MAASPAAQAASVVLVAMRPMPSKSIAESVLPGLKPYQPNHRMKPPTVAIVRSCGSIGPPPSRLKPAEPWPEHDRTREGDESADAVHHRRAREVVEAGPERREEVAVVRPPVRFGAS